MIEISIEEYIQLLEYKLRVLLQAQQEDSSWNYGIEELQEQIKSLFQSPS